MTDDIPSNSHPLDVVQRWMQAVIVHPLGVERGLASPQAREAIDVPREELESIVLPSRAQSSVERLSIYANAYYARLLECLRAEFPMLARAVGEDAFDQFALHYLQRYPSSSYTLGRLGAKFAQFLDETRPGREASAAAFAEPGWPDFLVDLATLEWTFDEVFDGPGMETLTPLSAERLTSVPPDRWGDVRLLPAPCLRLLAFRFPVNAHYVALRKEVGTGPSRLLAELTPRTTWMAVGRREYVVRRYDLNREQYELLSALVAGAPLGEGVACVVPEDESAAEQFAGELREWFAWWTADGFFRDVELR